MIVLSALGALFAAVLLLPTLSDLLGLLRAPFARARERGGRAGAAPPRLLVLIPAHDEELLVGGTIRSVQALRYPADRVTPVVLADNCTDRTAEVARRFAVAVLERHEPALRGKPHALAWAMTRLPLAEHDAVVILDADAVVDPDFATAVAAAGPLRECAFQTYNDVANRGENALTCMAAVFSAVRVRMNALKDRVGLNSPMSNGLVIGTDVLRRHGWQAFSICEDWELYAIYTTLGVRIGSIAGARTGAQEARSLAQGASQRTRWAAGKLTVLRRHAGALLRAPIGLHQKLDVLAELTAVGPAVHAGGVALLVVLLAVVHPPFWTLAAGLLTASVARPVIYTLLAVARGPQPVRTMLAFSYLPFYTAWRLGVQLRALALVGDRPWVRTARHAAPADIN